MLRSSDSLILSSGNVFHIKVARRYCA